MSRTDPHAIACNWFRVYCDSLGLRAEYEPDLGITKRPDFIVRSGSFPVVCEIKTFKPGGAFALKEGQKFIIRDLTDGLKIIRNSIREAATQLRPLSARGVPLVIILADPCGAQVPLSETLYAMYGNMQALVSKTDGIEGSTWTLYATRDGKLRDNHTYISAVLVLEQVASQPLDLCATIIETMGKNAVTLPEGLFAGPNDRRWRLDKQAGSLKEGSARR